MNLNITQQNLYLLLPGKMTTLAQFYAEDHGCSMVEAIRQLYASPLYERLEDESTKLWQLGATTLYEEMEKERYIHNGQDTEKKQTSGLPNN